MIAQALFHKLEITFWDLIIPLMTNSPAFQKLFRRVYHSVRSNPRIAWAPPLVLAWAGLGLVTGLILGHTGITLW